MHKIYYSMLLKQNVCLKKIELMVLCLITMFNLREALYVLLINVIFLGLSISRDILNRDIQSSINTFNRKCNEVSLDFSILNGEIKSKLISTFCMDLYECSFWKLWFKLC